MPTANGIRRLDRRKQESKYSKPDGANAMGINKREEGKKINSNINVTPMVDVMLVLLIIFMVITPMLNNKVNVDLPKADAAVVMEDANKEDAVVVAVTRDGRTFLGGDQVTLDDLGPKISAKLENKPGNKEVFMRADQRANYGKVMDAVDGIRSAGVSQLGLLTERVDDSGATSTPAKK
jgi:biopolymer transport protein ExbD/biopolymer transport protein TolR